jgi:hypothetical protein
VCVCVVVVVVGDGPPPSRRDRHAGRFVRLAESCFANVLEQRTGCRCSDAVCACPCVHVCVPVHSSLRRARLIVLRRTVESAAAAAAAAAAAITAVPGDDDRRRILLTGWQLS